MWSLVAAVSSEHDLMDDTESTASWLRDDHRIIICALVSLALVVGGRTWHQYHKEHANALRRARIIRLVENSRRDKERVESKTIASSTSIDGPLEDLIDELEQEMKEPPQTEEMQEALSAAGQSSRSASSISKRSKERRKRGRDVYKEVLKQERKKSKGANTTRQQQVSHPNRQRDAPDDSRPLSSASHASSSRSSSSQARSSTDYESADETPRPAFVEWEPSTTPSHVGESSGSTLSTGPAPNVVVLKPDAMSLSGSATSLDPVVSNDQTDTSATTSESSAGGGSPKRSSTSSPQVSLPNLTQENVDLSPSSSFSSPITLSQPIPSSDISLKTQLAWLENGNMDSPKPSRGAAKNHPKTPSTSSAASIATTSVSDASSSWDTQSIIRGAKSPPPRFRSRSRASMSPMPMTPAVSTTTTPPPLTTTSAQIASYKGALEAARQREENARKEMERYKAECDILRFRWNDDAERRRRREAELTAQVQHLATLLQTLAMPAVASPPPQLQAFLHQQPLHSPLAQGTFPGHHHMQFAYPPNAFSGPSTNNAPPTFPYPNPFFPSSYPITPAPNNTLNSTGIMTGNANAGSSPARSHDFLSKIQTDVNGVDGIAGGNERAAEEFDDVNEELAEAILKRPDSLRSPSSASASGSRSTSVAGRASREGFTFPSLSEIGNPQHGRSRAAVNHQKESQERKEGDYDLTSPRSIEEDSTMQRRSDDVNVDGIPNYDRKEDEEDEIDTNLIPPIESITSAPPAFPSSSSSTSAPTPTSLSSAPPLPPPPLSSLSEIIDEGVDMSSEDLTIIGKRAANEGLSECINSSNGSSLQVAAILVSSTNH